MKHLIVNILFSFVVILSPSIIKAEEKKTIVTDNSVRSAIYGVENNWNRLTEWCEDHKVLNSLDLGISLSSMGLGIELKTPVTKWVDLRAGVDWIPRFNVPLTFNLNTYADGTPTGNFQDVADMLYNMTGIYMDEKVHMKGSGSMTNFKLMLDFFPAPENRHWHISAGFYLGTSEIANTYNTYEEKPTLVGLNIYNRAYEYFTNLESIFDVPLGGGNYMDPQIVEKLQRRFREYGRMGIHIGDFKDGAPYIMDPAPDGTISAKAFVNRFKPYLGIGYSTNLDHNKKWHLGIDLGAVFWGGVTKIINHDYKEDRDINFTKDLINLRGKVADYVSICKSFPVYPLFALRISYSIL